MELHRLQVVVDHPVPDQQLDQTDNLVIKIKNRILRNLIIIIIEVSAQT